MNSNFDTPVEWNGSPAPISTGQDLLIVDDCRLYREGLAASVAREFVNGSVRTADDSAGMARALSLRPPNVILLNLASYDSRAVMQAARRHSPGSRLIVLGVSEDDEAQIVACAEAGVRGYHLRSGSLADLLVLIAGVLAGESPCSPRVAAVLMRRVSALADQGRSERKVLALTERENQILQLVELGLSNKQIADKLCIGIPTVKNHVHSLLAKLGVRRRADAVAVARGRLQGAGI